MIYKSNIQRIKNYVTQISVEIPYDDLQLKIERFRHHYIAI